MGLSIGLGLYTGQRQPGTPVRHYADAVAVAVAAEQAGFDSFWVSEHHGWADGYLPSPLVLLAGVATATERIALGTAVVVAPLHDPRRLAEDVTVVDHLSNGRLILGLGIGYLDEEYAMFGVVRATHGRRLETAIAVLREGSVSPAPLRPGGPQIWLGGYADRAVDRAASLADGHVVGRGEARVVDAATSRLGTTDRATFTRAVIVVCVLDDDGGHAAQARQAFATQQLGYERMQGGRDVYGGLIADPARARALAAGSIDAYVQVAGTAPEVAAGLRRVEAQIAGWQDRHLILRIVFPDEPLDAQLRRIEAFGATVLPAVRATAR